MTRRFSWLKSTRPGDVSIASTRRGCSDLPYRPGQLTAAGLMALARGVVVAA
jgi:hypothetical protein